MKKMMFLLLLIYSGVSSGQEYHKLLNESFYWDVPYADMGYICLGFGETGPYRYKISGDTLINNSNYSKVYIAQFINLNPPPSPNCPPFAVDTVFSLIPILFLREDTLAKKVWRYTTFNTPEEILLFDFSVEQGDTIHYAGLPDVIIDTIFNIVTYDGEIRKKFEFGVASSFPGGYFIEGLGGAGGLLAEPYYYFEEGPWLLCVVDHFSNTIWNNYNNCFDFITKVPLNEQETSLDIYPNPFSDVIRIETKVNKPAIKVYNLFGIEIFSGEINDCSSVDLSFLKAGIYIIAIFNDHSIERIERIIKTN